MGKTTKTIAIALTALALFGTTACTNDAYLTEGTATVKEHKTETRYKNNKRNRPYTSYLVNICPTEIRVEGDTMDCRWTVTSKEDYHAVKDGETIIFTEGSAYRK